METGTMNQRITIQRLETTVNENGLETEEWRDCYLCWAYVNGVSGSEFWAAHAVQAENTVVFTVRYCKKVAEVNPKQYRILFGGVPYNITHVDHVRFGSEEVKIKAVAQNVGVRE